MSSQRHYNTRNTVIPAAATEQHTSEPLNEDNCHIFCILYHEISQTLENYSPSLKEVQNALCATSKHPSVKTTRGSYPKPAGPIGDRAQGSCQILTSQNILGKSS